MHQRQNATYLMDLFAWRKLPGTLTVAVILFVFCQCSLPVNAGDDAKTKAGSRSKLVLYGHIDELSYLCSATGLRLSSAELPSKVAKLSLGSAAMYAGVRPGDTVLRARTADNNLVLTLERGGKVYEASIATDVHGLKSQFEQRKIPFTIDTGAFDKELTILARYQLAILVDRSSSMGDNHAGCPGDLTKWRWCRQQIDGMYLATSRLLEDGFDLVPFNNTCQKVSGVSFYDLRQVFERLKPQGTDKNISRALQLVLDDHFSDKSPHRKPLLVVVLTDGIENVGPPLQDVLITASKESKKNDEINVVFMQVGDLIFAEELFDDLDRNLIAKGAQYHIASYKPFTELRNKGLLWEILSSIRTSILENTPHR